MASDSSTERGSPTTGLRLLAKQLRSDASVAISIFLAVFLSGLVLISTPRLFEETSDDALQAAIRTPEPPARNLTLRNFARIGPSFDDNPLSNIKEDGDRFLADEVPESVKSIIHTHSFVFDSPQFRVSAFPGDEQAPFDTFLRIRYQEGIEDHIRVVAGSLPTSRDSIVMEVGDDCPLTGEGGATGASDEDAMEDIDCEETDVPLFELAVSEATLEELRVDVGDRLILTPDETDFLFRNSSLSSLDYQLAIEISALIEPLDPEAEYWYADERLDRPRIVENPDFVIIFATGLTTPADYRPLVRETGLAAWWFTWRYFVDADLVDAAAIDILQPDIRSLEANFPPSLGLQFGHQTLSTDLPTIIDGYIEQRTLTVSMLSLTLVGLFAVAAATVVVLAALATTRQRRAILLLRNRGASKVQLVAARLAQALVLCVPSVGLAYLISIWLAPNATGPLSWQIALLLAASATTIVVLTGLPLILTRLGSLQSDHEKVRTASVRRLVVEALLVAVAAGAVILLRRRVLIEENLGRDGEFDPLLALAPVLLGVAVGIAAVRLYVLPVKLLAWLGSLRRRLVMFVGFRRVLSQPAIAKIPMIVVLVAVAVAVFSSIIRLSISEGQAESTWHAVGADYRLTADVRGSALPTQLDLVAVDAAEATALGFELPGAAATQASPAAPPTVDLLALEMTGYAAVVDGTRADPGLPDFLTTPPTSNVVGDIANPIPVVASRFWLPTGPPGIGDRFALDLGHVTPLFEVREVREEWPGMPLGRQFVIASLETVRRATAPLGVKPTMAYIRADQDAGTRIEQAIDEQTQSTRLTSRDELFGTLHDAPFAAGLDRGLGLTFALSTVFAIVAAVASLALLARTRRRDFGYLRTLGSTTKQAFALTIIEQLPPVITAVVLGTALGVGTVVLFEPGIDINAFSGPGLPAELQVNAGAIFFMVSGILGAVMLVIGIFGFATRRENLGRLLRAGEDE